MRSPKTASTKALSCQTLWALEKHSPLCVVGFFIRTKVCFRVSLKRGLKFIRSWMEKILPIFLQSPTMPSWAPGLQHSMLIVDLNKWSETRLKNITA